MKPPLYPIPNLHKYAQYICPNNIFNNEQNKNCNHAKLVSIALKAQGPHSNRGVGAGQAIRPIISNKRTPSQPPITTGPSLHPSCQGAAQWEAVPHHHPRWQELSGHHLTSGHQPGPPFILTPHCRVILSLCQDGRPWQPATVKIPWNHIACTTLCQGWHERPRATL